MDSDTIRPTRSTSHMLTAGMVAGPFYIILSLIQAFTRDGFDWVRHPASLLSLGDLGWIQISTFVLTGIMYIISGVGLGKVVTDGVGRTWIRRLFIMVGIAMIIGGVFVADPGMGFPPGTPQGMPAEMSWHSTIHGFAPVLGFFSLVAAFFVFAKRFGSQGSTGWKRSSILIGISTLVLTAVPNFTANWETGEFNFLPLWAGVTIGFFYASVVIGKIKGSSAD